MFLKPPPKVFHIIAKTHKLTVFLNAPHPTTIAALKSQALAALAQFADGSVPKATSVDDFEFCRATRQQGKIVAFDVLETHLTVRDSLSNWETIYFRFRNEETGRLTDVNVEHPVEDDGEPELVVDKGKRKEPAT